MRICSDSPAARRAFEVGAGLGALTFALGLLKRLGVLEWPRLRGLADTPTLALSSGGMVTFVALRILAWTGEVVAPIEEGDELEPELEEGSFWAWGVPINGEGGPDVEKIIHNKRDSRELVQEMANPSVDERAKYVAAIILGDKLMPAQGGWTLKPNVVRLRDLLKEVRNVHLPVAKDVNFGDHRVPCYGTAFLVAKDIVATAAHCICNERGGIDGNRLDDMAIVFNLRAPPAEEQLFIPKSEVYRPRNVVYRKYVPQDEAESQDWALIQLDRPVSDEWLEVNLSWEPKFGDNLYMLGHPFGLLPQVYAGMASVRQASRRQPQPSRYEFRNDLDAFQGNSGSPIFDADGRVVGIFTRGPDDEWSRKRDPEEGDVAVPTAIGTQRRYETGMVVSRLDFVRVFLDSLRATPPLPAENFEPGLSVEGICKEHGDRVAHLGRGNFNMNRQCWETPCGECETFMHGDSVNTMALTDAFFSLRGRVSHRESPDQGRLPGLGIDMQEWLGGWQLLRFDVQTWRFIHVDIPAEFNVETLRPGLTLRATRLPRPNVLNGTPVWFHIGEEGHFDIGKLKAGLEHHPLIRFGSDWACMAVDCWVWPKGTPTDGRGDLKIPRQLKATLQPLKLDREEVTRRGIVLSTLLLTR